MYYVYEASNRINGKSYIGITSRCTEERWLEHLSRARCGARNSRLYDAIRKYGADSFEVKTIDQTEDENLVRVLEKMYIIAQDSYHNGYNCNFGGCGFLEFPDDIKKKISDAQKGKIISPESRKKMSEAKIGDSACAKNFGEHVEKGASNPRSKWYIVELPDGSISRGRGLREFCRNNNVSHAKLSSKKKSKGFKLIGTFNDYPEREYSQVTGSAIYPKG